VQTERKALLSGTLERSNSNRELVKRKVSPDTGRHIRMWDRKLSQASKGWYGALEHRADPTEVWKPSSDGERISDVEAG
jgi:hypothetical protein